jgi:hypothetical protein
LKRNNALIKFEGPSEGRKKHKNKQGQLEMMGSPKHVLQKFDLDMKKSKQKVKERMSLVFNMSNKQGSPNYSSNAEKRLYKGASQRDFGHIKDFHCGEQFKDTLGDLDFKKLRKYPKQSSKNVIEVQTEYSHLSFFKSGASSRQNSPDKPIRGKYIVMVIGLCN